MLALPMIAKLFGEILEGKHSIDAIHSEIQDICDVIEDTTELRVGSFEIGLRCRS